MFADIFSKNAPILIFFWGGGGKISALRWSRSKNFLNSHVVNLSVCLLNILFGYNFRKKRGIARKFWYVFKLHRSDLPTKISHRIWHILFYRALQEFKYIYCSFLMAQIGTKFCYVFKLHRSHLHTKISHRIQHTFFLQSISKFWIH